MGIQLVTAARERAWIAWIGVFWVHEAKEARKEAELVWAWESGERGGSGKGPEQPGLCQCGHSVRGVCVCEHTRAGGSGKRPEQPGLAPSVPKFCAVYLLDTPGAPREQATAQKSETQVKQRLRL